jgi:hypothetical protein
MHNIRLFASLFLLLSVSAFSQTTPESRGKNVSFRIARTACYGTCPVYTLTILKNCRMLLTAEENLKLNGTYQGKLSKTEMKRLAALFEEKKFFGFKDQYTSTLTDLPTTYLYFSNQAQDKTIKLYGNIPPELKSLATELEKLLDTQQWTKITGNE